MLNNRGVALAIALCVMAMVTGMSSVYVLRAVQEKNSSQYEVSSGKALYTAEAGGNSGLLTLDNIINFYTMNKVSATNPSVVASQAGTYATSNNALGFLLTYAMNGTTPLLTQSGSEALYNSSTTTLDGGTYSYVIRIGPKSNPTSPKTNVWDFPYYYKIQVTALNGGVRQKSILHGDFTMRVQKDNFARYALFTSHQTTEAGGVIWFTNTSNFTGPIFTNGRFNFARNPAGIFNGTVKQAELKAQFYNNNNPVLADADSYGSIDVPQFNSGFQRGVAPISMPTSTQESDMIAEASGGTSYGTTGVYLPVTGSALKGGVYVKGDVSISMSVDSQSRQVLAFTQGSTTSTITLDRVANQTTIVKGGTTNTYSGLPDGASNVGSLVYVNGNIAALGGVVQRDNQMTISSYGDLKITNNIRYQDYTPESGNPGTAGYVPPSAEGADNLLGLLTWHGDAKIATTAPTDVDIHATVMAKEGVFEVENYNTSPLRGAATVMGGVITNYYGGFGTFNSSTGNLTAGYLRNFIYDQRMETSSAPPYFPTMSAFVVFTNDIADKLVWQQGGF